MASGTNLQIGFAIIYSHLLQVSSVEIRHYWAYLHSDNASPKPGKRRRAPLLIFVMIEYGAVSLNINRFSSWAPSIHPLEYSRALEILRLRLPLRLRYRIRV